MQFYYKPYATDYVEYFPMHNTMTRTKALKFESIPKFKFNSDRLEFKLIKFREPNRASRQPPHSEPLNEADKNMHFYKIAALT